MNRERAKSRIFELLDARNPQPVQMTPKGIQHLAAELVHSIIDAIADELDVDALTGLCEADLKALEPEHRARVEAEAKHYSQTRGIRIAAALADPKGRKGYDY